MKEYARYPKSNRLDASAMILLPAIFLVLILVFVGSIDAGEAPSVEKILARYVNAVGGTDAIQKVSSRACTGRVVTDLSSRQKPVYEECSFEAFSSLQSKYSLKTYSDAGEIIHAYDGRVAWTQDKDGLHIECVAENMPLSWILIPQNALDLHRYYSNLEYAGMEYIDGQLCHILISIDMGETLYFSRESGLLIRIGNFCTLKDYYSVNGVLFPHRIEFSRKGGSTAYVFDRVYHNICISDAMFSIPVDVK